MEPSMEPSTEPGGRLLALGTQLVEVHIWLREELERLRAQLDGSAPTPGAGGAARPRELRAHCLAFCSALRWHHDGEDGAAFPALAEGFPELRPVLAVLERDHEFVAGILRRLEELAGATGGATGGTTGAAPADAAEARRVRAELDGLAAVLESHFAYEERTIVAALNSLGAGRLDGATFTLPPSAG
jgi:Hemerythrin HHE cation binding domain